MVKFENIEIKYGDFVAIENLNLDIKEGEFFTFLGPSGCGKTTSLQGAGWLSLTVKRKSICRRQGRYKSSG